MQTIGNEMVRFVTEENMSESFTYSALKHGGD
jgi:hypothetical protein